MMDFSETHRNKFKWIIRKTRPRQTRHSWKRRRGLVTLERLEERVVLSFTPIALPSDILPNGNVYTDGSTLIPITISDGSSFSSITDGNETVSFSQSMTAATSPSSGWFTQWGTSPSVELANTKLSYETGSNTLTLNFSKPDTVFGLELAPDSFQSVPMTATFYDGGNNVGSITQTVNYTAGAGALLFAAATNQEFTNVVLSEPIGSSGIAIAQVRYNIASAELSLTKTVSQPQASGGQQTTYTIGLSNAADTYDALGTVVTDPLPVGTTFQGLGTLPMGWTETDPGIGNSGTVTFSDSNPFSPGETTSFSIKAEISSSLPIGTTLTDTATASSVNSNSPSCSASLQVVSPIVDLEGNSFLIQRDSLDPNFVDFTTDGVFYHQWANTIKQINLAGWSGNNSLTVDSSNGLINNATSLLSPNTPIASIPISFDASTNGDNELILQQTGGPTIINDVIDVGAGAAPSQGESLVTDNSGNPGQTVFFYNLSPIFDSLPAPVLTITPSIAASLLNASNAINYTQGVDTTLTPNPAWGQVTVDTFEPLNFTNKDGLSIDSGPGLDQINIDDPTTPTGDTGPLMTTITVSGGASVTNPSASSPSDTLNINGTGSSDTIDYTTGGPGAGTVTDVPPSGPALPSVNFSGIGALSINGQEGNVALSVTTALPYNQATLTPGTSIDSGYIDFTSTAAPVSDTSLNFSNLGVLGSLTFSNETAVSAGTLVYNGTNATNTFIVSAAAGTVTLTNSASGVAQIPVFYTPDISNLVLNGVVGFNSAILNGDARTAASAILGGSITSINGGDLGSIMLSGVSTIDLSNGIGDINVMGTAGLINDLVITPTTSVSATIFDNSSGPLLTTTNSGSLTLGNVAGNSDSVSVMGSSANTQFNASDGISPIITSSFKTITLGVLGVASLNVNAGPITGNLTVDSSSGAFPIPITFNGGRAGILNLIQGLAGSTATSETYSPSIVPGFGSISLSFATGPMEIVSFANVSGVFDAVPSNSVIVNGNSANNDLNYTSGDSSPSTPNTNWGAIVIDNLAVYNFVNKAALSLDAGTGIDTVSIDNLNTPSGLAAITINGGVGADTLVVNANGNPVKSSYITGSSVSIPIATPVVIGYSDIAQLSIINSADELTGSPTSIAATQNVPLNNVLVASFGFTDQPPYELSTATSFSAQINWGDGTVANPDISAGTIIQLPPVAGVVDFQVYGTHTYTTLPSTATLPVSVTIFDMGSSRVFTPSGGTTPVTITANPGAMTSVSPIISTISVAVAPLTPNPALTLTGIEGNSTGTILIGSFSDADPAATPTEFTNAPASITVNWGDGTPLQSLSASNLTLIGAANGTTIELFSAHTYSEEGQYGVTMTITKAGGVSGTTGSATILTATAIISDAPLTTYELPLVNPPIPLIQPRMSTNEATIFPISVYSTPLFNGAVATFNDQNPTAPLSDFTATIDWGDGTSQSGGSITQPNGVGTPFVVSGSHTYATSGVNGGIGLYSIMIYISDLGGSKLTVTNTAHVADVPIVLTGKVNLSTISGQSTSDYDVTNNTQPGFSGTSAAFSSVSVFATPIAGGAPILLGSTQAFGNGAWSLTSTASLANNEYTITASAVDQFGETTTTPITIMPALIIDTVGPTITNLTFNRMNATLTVTFQDNLSGMDLASVEDSAFYHLSAKPLSKKVPVLPLILPTSITVTPGTAPGDPVTATVVFHNGKELRGGLYTVLIDSGNGNAGIEDNAENALSGNFYGTFPTGNGRPGGSFEALIATFHNQIQPFVPSASGYVSPSSASDPPAGSTSSGASGSSQTNQKGSSTTTHAPSTKPSAHSSKGSTKQSLAKKTSLLDQALEHLINQVGNRPKGG